MYLRGLTRHLKSSYGRPELVFNGSFQRTTIHSERMNARISPSALSSLSGSGSGWSGRDMTDEPKI
jgi:hypothetical protein